MTDPAVHIRKHATVLTGSTSVPPSLYLVLKQTLKFMTLCFPIKFHDGKTQALKFCGILLPVVSTVDPFPTGTGMWMSLPVAARSVWSCIISHQHPPALGAPICSSGMMTDATWRTILFANIPMVMNPLPSPVTESQFTVSFHKQMIVPSICYVVSEKVCCQCQQCETLGILVKVHVTSLPHWGVITAKEWGIRCKRRDE